MEIKSSSKDFYQASPELLAAINTALFLKKPLLLAGEPGTGKTQCADFIARRLNALDPKQFENSTAIRFDTKSTSQYNDLFYSYDAVSHFANKEAKGERAFISFNGLGKAILTSNGQQEQYNDFRNYSLDIQNSQPSGSVVLIDEIDKAPRDFPNDLLAELEKPPFKFKIKEAHDLEIQQKEEVPIVIIISSNNEKSLPDAFLRRCIFHYIDFPGPEELLKIVESNLKMEDPRFLPAIELFLSLKKKGNLSKEPATSELIDWIKCLQKHNVLHEDEKVIRQNKKTGETLGTIAKSREDFESLKNELEKG